MNTTVLLILIGMLVLFLLKVPIYASMGLTGVALMLTRGGIKWGIISQYLYTGTNSFTLLSIPLFLLAAKLMNTGGITRRLFAVAVCKAAAAALGRTQTMDINAEEKARAIKEAKEMDIGL